MHSTALYSWQSVLSATPSTSFAACPLTARLASLLSNSLVGEMQLLDLAGWSCGYRHWVLQTGSIELNLQYVLLGNDACQRVTDRLVFFAGVTAPTRATSGGTGFYKLSNSTKQHRSQQSAGQQRRSQQLTTPHRQILMRKPLLPLTTPTMMMIQLLPVDPIDIHAILAEQFALRPAETVICSSSPESQPSNDSHYTRS